MTESIYTEPENRKLLEKIGLRIEDGEKGGGGIFLATDYDVYIRREVYFPWSILQIGVSSSLNSIVRGVIQTWLDRRMVVVAPYAISTFSVDKYSAITGEFEIYEAGLTGFTDRDTANIAAIKAVLRA